MVDEPSPRTIPIEQKGGEHTARWAAPGLVGVVIGAVITVIGALITGGFNYLSHQNDLDAKMIELSLDILRAPVKEETEPLRHWAVDVIDRHAKIHFNEAQRAALLKDRLPPSVPTGLKAEER